MSNGVFITRVEWNQLMKEIKFIKDYILNTSKPVELKKWITEREAMDLIGCKERKLKELRSQRKIEFKYASMDSRGYGRSVLISCLSVEAYIEATTKEGIYR